MLTPIILEFMLELLPVAYDDFQQCLILQAPTIPAHAFFRIHLVPIVIVVMAAVFACDGIIEIHVGFKAVIRDCVGVAVCGAGFGRFGCGIVEEIGALAHHLYEFAATKFEINLRVGL